MNNPKVIIIHHSGGTEANPLADTSHHTFEIIKDYHVSKGWGDIGYNWVIEKSGKICKGRDETMDGAHTIGMNKESIGICLVGNFDLSYPTKEQEESLKIVYKDLITRYPNLKGQVFPHRKYSQKSCYGKNLSDDWALSLLEPKEQPKTVEDSPIETADATPAKIKNILTSNRMKSLYWRTGMMILALIIGTILSNLDVLAPVVSPATITMLGLILGEVSKAINSYLHAKN